MNLKYTKLLDVLIDIYVSICINKDNQDVTKCIHINMRKVVVSRGKMMEWNL